MASPAPVSSAPIRRRRSFAGPIVLIVMGVVFLLANLGVLSLDRVGHWFASYWPILIILWGVIKLVEYQQAQREGTRAPGIGVGGVFLLVFLIIFGLGVSQFYRLNLQGLRDQMDIDDADFALFGHTYTFDDQLAQAFPAGAGLHVVNDRGAVNINASDDGQIRVVIHKRVTAQNQEDADKWNAGTKPQITVSGSTVTLNANTQGSGDHWVSTDLDVSIPRKASVVISGRRGDVSVLGRDGDLEVTAQRGEVVVTDVTGKASLSLSGSSGRVSRVTGDVTIDGRPKDVSVEDVKGTVRLNGEFDSIRLSKITDAVTFKSSRTDLQFTKLDGDMDIDSDDLQGSGLVGPLRLTTRSKDIRLDGVTGDVRLQNENGAVEVHMTKLGSMQVDNRRADIQIYVPDKAAFQLDARSRGSDFQTDFDQLKVDNSKEQATATGTIGSGGPHIVINNDHGSIELRKGSSAAAAPEAPELPKMPKAPKASKAPAVPTEN